MKRGNIFIFVSFVLSLILLTVSSFAGGQSVVSRKEIRNLLQKEQKGRITVKDSGRNYLHDIPLDYLNYFLILYTENMKEKDYEYVEYSASRNGPDPLLFLRNEYETFAADDTQLPSLFDQFNIMTYLIYNGQNSDLKRLLKLGYNEDIYVNVYLPNETKTITVLTQAVLSNNKEALKIISDSMKGKKSALGGRNIDKEMGKVWFGTLQSLIPADIDEDYQYDQTDLTNKYNYAKENLNAETIAGLIVGAEDGSRIILFQYVDIILNENNGKNAHLFFDALNLLTDRRSQGF